MYFCADKYSASDMTFRWKGDSPLSFPSDFADGCRLPRYVVSFEAQPNTQIIYYGESKYEANIGVRTLRIQKEKFE